MNRIYRAVLMILLIGAFPLGLMANELIVQADTLFDQGGLDNYKQAGELLEQALKADPNNFEATWKAARSFREYGETAKRKDVTGWEEICATYGKKAMEYGEKATQIEPERVEGYFWYGASVGVYSDGVSIFKALKEGLKGKTQSNLEKAYALDKSYNSYGPTIALGRFWYVLPGIAGRDKKLSEQYLREALQNDPDNYEAQVYLAEVLLDSRKTKEEALVLLKKAVTCDDDYMRAWAKRLLEENS